MPLFPMTAAPGWAIGERLGWINYFGSRAAAELSLDDAARVARIHSFEATAVGGRLLWVTEEPLDFHSEAHRQLYGSLLGALSSRTLPQ
jgi:hypothetical protein